jgi:hypothetical protein
VEKKMSGNLTGWQPKIAKKDAQGNYHLGKWTVSATVGSVIIAVVSTVWAWYQTLPTPTNEVNPVSVTTPLTSPAPSKAVERHSAGLSSNFSAGEVRADLIVPNSKVDVYKLVKIKTDRIAQYHDLLVMTIASGQIMFVDTVATANSGEWVFTGPPGQYSIRLTSFDPNTGFNATTGTVTIGTNPNPPTPPNPPGPPNPPVPPDVVIPEGKYGFGPLSYNVVTTQVTADYRSYASKLADNFEAVAAGIAAGSYKTPDEANKELAGRNRFTFSSDPTALTAWMPFFNAWSAKTTELNKAGKLPNMAAEYALVYKETSVGLRGVK